MREYIIRTMISVTVAAQGKPKRLFGGNLKAYGSGRISMFELQKEMKKVKDDQSQNVAVVAKVKLLRLAEKLFHFFTAILNIWFPYLMPEKKQQEFVINKVDKTSKLNFSELDGDLLVNIFSHLHSRDVLKCKLVCKQWNTVACDNLNKLIQIHTDQIRILFDEGEIVFYPLDEKKCPSRHQLPSLQILRNNLRHMTTQSLFVRGLIPVESEPVLQMLLELSLQPQQIYFIWSKFSPDSIPLLERLIAQFSDTITDFGLEECSPPQFFTDQLFMPIKSKLTSLRLWNNGKETIDLGTCFLSSECVASVVKNWKEAATCDLAIVLTNCLPVNKTEVLRQLSFYNITLQNNRKLHSRTYTLTFIC
ncbi:unnamed protein product [Caenorhabditis sp. 36 PRJEB53466]|nr:unnamed protein product [Caenorhabditis sp. 36 PRJEB53466]